MVDSEGEGARQAENPLERARLALKSGQEVRLALRSISSSMQKRKEVDDDGRAQSEADLAAREKYEEYERRRAETDGIKQRNEDRKLNRALREAYAKSVMRYLIGYSLFVAVMLVLAGFKAWNFSLADSVLEFLVGSTAAAAIGLVLAVTTGLFSGLGKGD